MNPMNTASQQGSGNTNLDPAGITPPFTDYAIRMPAHGGQNIPLLVKYQGNLAGIGHTWALATVPAAAAAPPTPPLATEATLLTLKPAIDASKIAIVAALSPLATEATLALITPAIEGLKGASNKTLTDLFNALAPLASGATEATLAQVNAKLATVNTDNAAMRTALSALQADSATMVGRVYNNHATQRIAAGASVNIPAGAWRSLSALFVPTVAGATINGASFDGMSLTSNLTMYEGSYTVTTNATTLVAIAAGNCDVFVTRTF